MRASSVGWFSCWFLFPIWLLSLAVASARGAEGASPPRLCVTRLNHEVVRRSDAARITLQIEISNGFGNEAEAQLALTFPHGAVVDRLGLWVSGRYMEGELAPREQARRTYDAYAHGRGVDPALLVWTGERTATLSVFPVPAQSSSQVLVAYVVPLPPGATVRVPLPIEEHEATTAKLEGEWPINLKGEGKVKAGETLVSVFHEKGKAGTPGFFSADLSLPVASVAGVDHDVVLVLVDTSYSMRKFDWPKALAAIGKLRGTKGVWWMPFDVMLSGVKSLQADADREILARVVGDPGNLDGASDLSMALRAAVEFMKNQGAQRGLIYWVTDGDDTWGQPDLNGWPGLLDELGCGRVAVELFRPDARLARALGAYHRRPGGLANVTFGPLAGVEQLGHSFHPLAQPGEILRVVGRCTGDRGALRVTCTLPDGSRASSVCELKFKPKAGNEHLPRLWAAGRIADLDLAYRLETSPERRRDLLKAAPEVALKYQILSRVTSFLVLQNERDLRESGIDRQERSVGWAEAITGQMRVETKGGNAWAPRPTGCNFSLPLPTGFLDPKEVFSSLCRGEAGYWPDGFETAWHGIVSPADFEGGLRWGAGLPAPPMSGCRAIPTLIPRREKRVVAPSAQLPERFRELWRKAFEARVCSVPENPDDPRWLVERQGDRTVLVCMPERNAPPELDIPDRFVLTADGLDIELPLWGMSYRSRLVSSEESDLQHLLTEFPFPTLFPLDVLLRGFMNVQVCEGPEAWWLWLEGAYETAQFALSKKTGLPIWVKITPDKRHLQTDLQTVAFQETENGLTYLLEDERKRVSVRWLDPVPGSLLPEGAPLIGDVDFGAVWTRIHTGTAGAEDYLRWALTEVCHLDRAEILECALKKKPAPATANVVGALYAEALTFLGRSAQASDQMRQVLKRVTKQPAATASLRSARQAHYELLFARMEADSSKDARVVWQSWAEKTGPESLVGRVASRTVRQLDDERTDSRRKYPPAQPRRGVMDLLLAQDVEAPAEDVCANASVGQDNLGLRGLVLGTQRARGLWPEALVQKLLLNLADRNNGHLGIAWLLYEHPRAPEWYEWLRTQRPDSVAVERSYLQRYIPYNSDIEEQSRQQFANLQSARRLAQAPFSPLVQLMARLYILKCFPWSVGAPREYLLETVRPFLKDGPVGRCREALRLVWDLGIEDVDSPGSCCTFTKTLSTGRLDLAGAVLEAGRLLDTADELSFCESYRNACRSYVDALASAGRRDDAREAAQKLGTPRPDPILMALADGEASREGCTDHLKAMGVRDLVGEIILSGEASDELRGEIDRRNLSDEITDQCLEQFGAAPDVFRRELFRALRGPRDARKALAGIEALRRTTGMKELYRFESLRLNFEYGMMREAADEADRLCKADSFAEGPKVLRAGALSLLGDGQEGVAAWRTLLNQRRASGEPGSAYRFVAIGLTDVSRHAAAFEVRKEALVECRRLLDAGAFKGTGLPEEWAWLKEYDTRLLDHVALPKGGDAVAGAGVLRTQGLGFRADLEAARKAARWEDFERLIEKNWEALDNAERAGWFNAWAEWQGPTGRMSPVLLAWLDGILENGAPAPKELKKWIAARLYLLRRVDLWLKHAEHARNRGDVVQSEGFVSAAMDLAKAEQTEDETARKTLFNDAVTRFGWYPDAAAQELWGDRMPAEIDQEIALCKKRRMHLNAKQGIALLSVPADELAQVVNDPATLAAVNASRMPSPPSVDELWKTAARDPVRILLGFTKAYLEYQAGRQDKTDGLKFVRWASEVLPASGAWADDFLKLGAEDEATACATKGENLWWLADNVKLDALTALLDQLERATLNDPTLELWEKRKSLCRYGTFRALVAKHRSDSRTWVDVFSRILRESSIDVQDSNSVDDLLSSFRSQYEHFDEEWHLTPAGRAFGLSAARLLLARPEARGEPLYAVMAFIKAAPAAGQGNSREERLAGLDLCLQSLRRLVEDFRAPAEHLLASSRLSWRCWDHFSDAESARLDLDPEVYGKRMEVWLTWVNVAPALGQQPRFDDETLWDAVPLEWRRTWLRMASRELELDPVRGGTYEGNHPVETGGARLSQMARELTAALLQGQPEPSAMISDQRGLRRCLMDSR